MGVYMKKKISKLLFALLIFMSIKSNVYAESFKCSVFGDDVLIDTQIAYIVKYIILILHIVVPILLVIMGSIDLIKGIVSQKEDEIKSGQKTFIKRLISAVIIFFVVAIVKLVISVAAKGDNKNIMDCVNSFIKGPSEEDIYKPGNKS